MDFKLCSTKKLRKEGSNFASRICDHVKMGSETVKGKLKLGAKIIQEGGMDNMFKQTFGMITGEDLLKASQCNLSTTAGPIAGLLYISTEKVAFISDSSITVPCSSGHSIRIPYKVLIPIKKIKRANQSKNVYNPSEKYIVVVTEDGYDFWFMGVSRYEQAFHSLQKALGFADIQLTTGGRRWFFLKSA